MNETKTSQETELILKSYPLISLTDSNISRIAMQVLYFKEQNQNTFVLKYDFKELTFPLEKIAQKLREQLISIIDNHNSIFYIMGFPRCFFEKEILKPGYRWKYEKSIIYLKGSPCIKVESCEKCMFYTECPGRNGEYIEKYKNEICDPILTNDKIVPKYEREFAKIKNAMLKKVSKVILNDFSKDTNYHRKRIMFVNDLKLPGKLNELSYFIENSKENFENTYKLLSSLFEKELLSKLKKFLSKTPQISLRFCPKPSTFQKSIYFSVSELTNDDLSELVDILSINLEDIKNLAGMRIIFEDNIYTSFEIIYAYEQRSIENLKKDFEEFELEKKKHILKFLNAQTKPIKNLTIAYKYENDSTTAARLTALFEDNYFKLNAISVLFAISVNFIEEYIPYSIDLKTSLYEENSIKIAYEIPLKEEIEQIEQTANN